jgi:hypothetical protein
LEGFTNPQGKFSVLDTAKQRWFETLPKSVAAVRGFYDYSEGAQPDQTADEAFQKFEDNFPALRREIVSNCWRPAFSPISIDASDLFDRAHPVITADDALMVRGESPNFGEDDCCLYLDSKVLLG